MRDIVRYQPRTPATPVPAPAGWNGAPEGYPDPVNEGATVKDYLAVIRRQFLIVLAAVVVCGGLAGYLAFSAPPRYQATTVIRLADARRALTGGDEASAYEQVLGRDTDVLLSQIQVLMSRQIAASAVEDHGLRLLPLAGNDYPPEITDVTVGENVRGDTVKVRFGDSQASVVSRRFSGSAPYGQRLVAGNLAFTVTARPRSDSTTFFILSRKDAIDNILLTFKAAGRPKTDIIDVSFTSRGPFYSERVANAMAQTFKEYNASTAQQASRRRRIFLEEQMRQTDAMLQSAIAEFSAFRSGNQVFSSREKATAQQAGIVDLDMRRADLDAQRRTYRSLLAQAQRADVEGLQALVSAPGIAANPVIQQLYGQLTAFQEKRDSLTAAGAAATNPDLVRITDQLSTTSGRLVTAVRNQVLALDAQIDALDNLKVRSTEEIASAPRAETEETRLSQQVQAVQRMAESLQEEHQKAKMAEAVEAGQVEIVDPAEAPSLPVAAGRIRKTVLGLIVGIMLGIGGAILIDGMNTSIRRRDDMERVLQVPGLAVIPQFASTNGRGKLVRALPRRIRNGQSPGNRAEGLVTVHDARSTGAEAYRTLRTNLIFSQAVQTLRTLVVTSAAPSEGKTTTAANLAVSFAQQGMRVLLADCDLRRSRLHRMFGVPREPGVTELVLGKVELEEAARETAVPGLYVLPSGQLPFNPAELLGGERMRDTLARLSEAYDLIVLDTPPLLAASDAAVLGTVADGVVLVVRAGVTEVEAGQQAIQQLMTVGARVVGAVLNDPDSKLKAYGGYYNYEYATDS